MFSFRIVWGPVFGSGDQVHWKNAGDAGVRSTGECKNAVQNRKLEKGLLQVGVLFDTSCFSVGL